MNKNIILACGIGLICIGIFRPNLNLNTKPQADSNAISIVAPSDNDIRKEAEEVTALMRASDSSSLRTDCAQLRDLYVNFAAMVSLDNTDVVINTTEEIRKANSISGKLLQALGLDVKTKYTNLAKECQDVIVTAIGDDNVALSPDLRKKAADGFSGLAWAFNEILK